MSVEKHISKEFLGFNLTQSFASRYVGISRRRRRLERIAAAIFTGLVLRTIWLYDSEKLTDFPHTLPCRTLPGASDTVVVMKTGVTEVEARLPIHFDTTLRCPPNSLVFSDHEELYQGQYEIRDVLANVTPTIWQKNDDFRLYRRAKEVGRQGLGPQELSEGRTTSKTTKEDKVQNAGWVLDKWKFLPLLKETFYLYPSHKWYVFMESDTYLFWTTTLKYLSTLDHTEPYCLGHRSTVKSPHPFAHGGSGYLISNAALRLVVDYIQANQAELDKFVESEWAGDIALGLVLKEAGVQITPTWPIYQPHHFGIIDFGLTYGEKSFWCYPAGSFHHVTPDTVEDLWNFEQEWIKEENKEHDPNTFIRHIDVFSSYILPRMRFPRDDWDNQCSIVKEDINTIEDCKNACIEDDDCLQYMFDTGSLECKTLDSVRFGEESLGSGLYSDWMFDRVERWRDDLPPCHGESFLYAYANEDL